jgi:hypothetical protein
MINISLSTKLIGMMFILFAGFPEMSLGQIPTEIQHTDPAISKKELAKVNYIPDTVFLSNGDKITGKILSFEQGRLSIDGQVPGILSIKWHMIVTISGGNRIFKVENIYGNTYYGRITYSSTIGAIFIEEKEEQRLVVLESIVRIFPLESEWYRGLKGDVSAGIDYTKSPEVLRINCDYNIYYVVKKWRFINDFSIMSTLTEEEENASLRYNYRLQELYALPHKWVLAEFNSVNRNDELGINSRISFAAGGGNSIVQNDRSRLLLLTGFAFNMERDIDSKSTAYNFEWPVSLQHTIYSFIRPDLSTTLSISSFVGITEKDRFRVDGDCDIAWEFVRNLKLILSFYYNYDNKILEGKNTTTDYGYVISLALKLK